MNVQPEIHQGIKTGRVETVDFARGLAASGVMLYHLLYGEQIAAYERIAYYCVYAFFVISGFALYLSQAERVRSAEGLQSYAKRRFLRIAPLFFAACALHASLIDGTSIGTFLLNVSLLFGFANPGSTSMVMGGWSIGIEVVFYIAFPAIVVLSRGRLEVLAALAIFSTGMMVHFANATLKGSTEMTGPLWQAYTQPISFFGYFAFGCLIGEAYIRYHRRLKGRREWWVVLLLALLPFAVVRVDHPTDLLQGWVGVLLMSCTIATVAATAFIKEPEGRTLQMATWLGTLSYPVYLLHPIVYSGIVTPIFDNALTRILLTVLATVALSIVVHRWIEKPFLTYRK